MLKRLARWFPAETLFSRAALALTAAFLLFGLVSTILLQLTLVRPHTKQAADDLASFLVLSAQIWVELPPFTRPDFERELLKRHDTRILTGEAAFSTEPATHSYIRHLETSLSRFIEQPVAVHAHPDYAGWLWADLPMAGRVMRLGFRETRLNDRMLLILPFLAGIGVFAAFAMAVLLVRHVTRPLAQISTATQRIGEGDFSAKIPESGPRELADLARKLNLMEGKIAELLENRTTLLAGISHDLRTPLARMRLELEMIDSDLHERLIQGLNDDIVEMDNLIQQALWLAKGLGMENAVATNVCEFVRQVLGGCCDARQAPIELECLESLVRPIQREALKRVLSNLIENALSYSDGQTVTVTCTCSRTGTTICVRDKGPGIPASERDKIFQPFYRLEQSRNKATGGSGLGLAIVAQLCQTYQWEISVVPADTPPGSVFCLRLSDPASTTSA